MVRAGTSLWNEEKAFAGPGKMRSTQNGAFLVRLTARPGAEAGLREVLSTIAGGE